MPVSMYLTKSKADQLYLRRDGFNKMLVDLDVNPYSLYGKYVFTRILFSSAIGGILGTNATVGSYFELKTFNGVGYSQAAKFGPHADGFSIPRAGDITFLNAKIVRGTETDEDLRDLITLWSDNVAYFGDFNGKTVLRGDANSEIRIGATTGVSGSFTTVDDKTVTVTKGIITGIV